MCSPSLVVAKLAIPTSMPTWRPVAGSRIGRHVVTREHQHPAPPLTFDLDRLHPPQHLAVHLNFDLPDALQIHPPCFG